MNLSKRAATYITLISLVTNPAFAGGGADILSKGWQYISKFGSKGSSTAEKTAAQKAAEEGATGARVTIPSTHEALAFKDDLDFKTTGLLKDLSLRVAQNIYAKTLGRDKDVVLLMSRLANNNNPGVALVGAEGTGRQQLLIGLQEQINLGAVPEVLQNAKVVQVSTNHHLMDTAESFGTQLEKLAEQVGESKQIIILYFDDVTRFIGERNESRFNQYLEIAQHKLGRERTRIVVRGELSQINKLAENNSAARNLTRQAVQALSDAQVEKVVLQYAERLKSETHFYPSKAALKKIIVWAQVYYGHLGMPTAANKLLADVVNLKSTLLSRNDSIVATELGKKRDELLSQLEMAQEIIAKEADDTGVAYARMRAQAIPEEVSKINVEIDRITASFKKFDVLRKEYQALLAELKAAKARGETTAREETSLRYNELKTQLGEIEIEDVALQINADKGVPLDELLTEFRPHALEDSLAKYREKIFGQSHVVEKIAILGQRIRSSIRNLNKPAGSVLLLGNPGTGKTEVSRTASYVEYGSYGRLIRKDMADYAEKHSVSGIKGAAPGYTGYGEGNDLVTQINNQPESVVLLDELEKANLDVINNTFLSVLSSAKMTNSQGKVGDFSRSLIIGTSNLGRNLTSKSTREEIEKELMTAGWSKEFLDRWDEILVTDPIDKKLWGFIFDMTVAKFNKDTLARSMNLFRVSQNARKAILSKVETGASDSARQVERAVEKLTDQIAKVIEKGHYINSNGDVIKISAKPGDIIDVTWSKTTGLTLKVAKKVKE